MQKNKTAVFSTAAELKAEALLLSKKLQLPVWDQTTPYDYLLILTENYLGIQKTGDPSLPLYVDFLSDKMQYRRKHTSLKKEMLARAMGLKGNTQPTIVDATAGLARDSFILAALGFNITLLERTPLIAVLVADGIKRASQDPILHPIIERLHLIEIDALQWMNETKNPPDIIYLDPMFPERTKSALVKKEMRFFHDIVGDDQDADKLLIAALACATKRVVVKRSRQAKHLADLTPTTCFLGKSSRFDVYITSIMR